MKKLILTLVLIAATSLGAKAQIAAYAHKVNTKIEGYTLPRTVVQVTVSQEREVIIRGPYATYAKTFLGVVGAPLTDKENYKILGAHIKWTTEPDPELTYDLDPRSGIATEVFQWIEPQYVVTQDKLPTHKDYEGGQVGNQIPFKDMGANTIVENQMGLNIDRVSALEKTEEQMAAEAADMIFKLRKRRIELITGEQGENVFGAGLQAALKEIKRLEKQYLELFLGKRIVQRTSKTFTVLPTPDQNNITAFRFSQTNGVVDASDVTGSPVNIVFTPQTKAVQPLQRKMVSKVVKLRMPTIEKVSLTDGITVFASELIPIYQKGVIVDAPSI